MYRPLPGTNIVAMRKKIIIQNYKTKLSPSSKINLPLLIKNVKMFVHHKLFYPNLIFAVKVGLEQKTTHKCFKKDLPGTNIFVMRVNDIEGIIFQIIKTECQQY